MEADPFAPARARAEQHQRELAEVAGPMLTISEVANLLGVDPPTLDQMREGSEVLTVRMNGEWRHPSIQFQGTTLHQRTKDVVEAHNNIDGWVMLDSVMAADPAFGNRSIIDLLKEKDDPAIDEVILQLREQFAF